VQETGYYFTGLICPSILGNSFSNCYTIRLITHRNARSDKWRHHFAQTETAISRMYFWHLIFSSASL